MDKLRRALELISGTTGIEILDGKMAVARMLLRMVVGAKAETGSGPVEVGRLRRAVELMQSGDFGGVNNGLVDVAVSGLIDVIAALEDEVGARA